MFQLHHLQQILHCSNVSFFFVLQCDSESDQEDKVSLRHVILIITELTRPALYRNLCIFHIYIHILQNPILTAIISLVCF